MRTETYIYLLCCFSPLLCLLTICVCVCCVCRIRPPKLTAACLCHAGHVCCLPMRSAPSTSVRWSLTVALSSTTDSQRTTLLCTSALSVYPSRGFSLHSAALRFTVTPLVPPRNSAAATRATRPRVIQRACGRLKVAAALSLPIPFRSEMPARRSAGRDPAQSFRCLLRLLFCFVVSVFRLCVCRVAVFHVMPGDATAGMLTCRAPIFSLAPSTCDLSLPVGHIFNPVHAVSRIRLRVQLRRVVEPCAGGGRFVLVIDGYERVAEIAYLGAPPLETENLLSLLGLPEIVMNRYRERIDAGQVTDTLGYGGCVASRTFFADGCVCVQLFATGVGAGSVSRPLCRAAASDATACAADGRLPATDARDRRVH